MAPELGRPLLHLPLIPEDVLKKHRVNLPFDDTRFRSAARLLQALWREERGLPIGSYIGEDGKRHQLGSRISNAAGAAGGNFLTAEIFQIARREVAYRETPTRLVMLSRNLPQDWQEQRRLLGFAPA